MVGIVLAITLFCLSCFSSFPPFFFAASADAAMQHIRDEPLPNLNLYGGCAAELSPALQQTNLALDRVLAHRPDASVRSRSTRGLPTQLLVKYFTKQTRGLRAEERAY